AHETLQQLFELERSTSWVVLPSGALGPSDTESYGCPTTVTLVKKMPLHTLNKRGVAMAVIPSCSLGAMLDRLSGTNEVMVIDDQQRVVLHPDPSMIGTALSDTGKISDRDLGQLGGSSGQFRTSAANEPISVTYVRSA